MLSLRSVACALLLVIAAVPRSGRGGHVVRFDDGRSYHVPALTDPRSDSDEVALALSAAPASLTAGAAVYVLHDGQFIKVRDGSTGWTCTVSRDARVNGVAPMCFDPEGARTLMREEMLRTRLELRGLTNTAIQREVDAAFQRGTLRHPGKPAIIYMMSSHQVLVVYNEDSTQVVGAWHPHLMIYLPGTSVGQFALGASQEAGPMSIPFTDAGGSELVIQVPHWADSRATPGEGVSHSDAGGGSR
jgi:hypothetical protein